MNKSRPSNNIINAFFYTESNSIHFTTKPNLGDLKGSTALKIMASRKTFYQPLNSTYPHQVGKNVLFGMAFNEYGFNL